MNLVVAFGCIERQLWVPTNRLVEKLRKKGKLIDNALTGNERMNNWKQIVTGALLLQSDYKLLTLSLRLVHVVRRNGVWNSAHYSIRVAQTLMCAPARVCFRGIGIWGLRNN